LSGTETSPLSSVRQEYGRLPMSKGSTQQHEAAVPGWATDALTVELV
jgi:hypothetical protein